MSAREQYRASRLKLYWGATGVKADLTPDLVTVAINGQVTVYRAPRQTSTERQGMTADGVAAGFTVQLSCRASDESRKLLSTREGILFFDRADAARVLAIPMKVEQVASPSDRNGAVMVTATLSQRNLGLPVEGARINTVGQKGVAAGHESYAVQAAQLIRRTANFQQVADEISVVGAGLVAEAAA